MQRNLVFVTNYDYPIPISLQSKDGDLRHFQLWFLLDQIILKYQRFTPLGCNDIGISTFEFVAKP